MFFSHVFSLLVYMARRYPRPKLFAGLRSEQNKKEPVDESNYMSQRNYKTPEYENLQVKYAQDLLNGRVLSQQFAIESINHESLSEMHVYKVGSRLATNC